MRTAAGVVPLFLLPAFLVVALAAAWVVVAGTVAALVAWPALNLLVVVAVVMARAATAPRSRVGLVNSEGQ